MRLLVHVIGARDLPALDLNGFCDPYVRLQLGKYRFRTKVVKKSLSPSWDEEFNFKADDLNDILTVSVLDEDKYFNVGFLGKVKVPVSKVFDAERQTLASTWFPLQPKSKKSRNRDCGEILLTISLSQNNFELMPPVSWSSSNDEREKLLNPNTRESPSISYSGSTSSSTSIEMEEAIFVKEEKQSTPTFVTRLVQILLSKSGETSRSTNIDLPSTVLQEAVPDHGIDDNTYDIQSSTTYDEALKSIETRDQGLEMPDILPGVLLDRSYIIPPKALNSLLFAPDSTFMKSLAEFQGTTDVQEGPWRLENGGESLKRVVTYTNAATKLVKAVKAIEEQMYLKADGKSFAVFKSVSTPDVPYGSCFKLELLFCVMPGPELSSGDQSSRLVISWRMNFLQNTMMKGMIEGGARKGLKDSYEQFAKLLSQTIKPVGSTDLGSDKDQILADLQMEQLSDWKLAAQYFWNFTVLSTMLLGLYCFIHIILAMPRTMQGLEFGGLDLPDSIGEVLVCGILVLQGEHVLAMISHFMHARWQRGSDHGVRAQGDGWLLTVALIEGRSIASVDSTGFSDPYVVFTCNGKARTSSIKFQTVDPHWNEIFEFDAMDEPPSMLDVEVFNFDGPFDEATSLGHNEINFVKSNISELADKWIPLQGKLAQAWQSKLHVRIFLDNTKGNDVKEFLTKMEKEVGKKLNLRSPQTNSAFQKLFRLPPEEFLINDFTCHLKRKMVLQGRLFLSTRIIGFYSNLFGHKTKFFFLWEDIKDIKVIPPSLASVGSPSIVIILHRGRGMDAKHGAKTQDEEGRLKFHFQSFASFQAANRTIMALWKSKSLSPEEKVQIAEEESDARTLQTEGSASFLELEDANVSEIYSSLLPVPINSLMELFSGGHLDRQVMEKMDYLDYSFTRWELVKPDLFQRQLYYKFNKKVSQYGEVNCTQQKYHLVGRNGWVIEEVMTLQGIPLGDYFTLHIKYQIEDVPSRLNACNVQVYLGIEWLKNTRNRKRISKNLESKVAARQREIFKVAEMEIMVAQKQYSLQREHIV